MYLGDGIDCYINLSMETEKEMRLLQLTWKFLSCDQYAIHISLSPHTSILDLMIVERDFLITAASEAPTQSSWQRKGDEGMGGGGGGGGGERIIF